MRSLRRRELLGAMLAVAATPLLARSARSVASGFALPAATTQLLETSPFIYVSPLRTNGQESRCHGEVWFAWLDGAAIVITARDRWKAKSIASGLDRARLWVGDHGRWKQLVGRNDAFKSAPGFEARARVVKDAALLDRVIAAYEKKYPGEIGSWRDRFKSGFASGERILIAYEPIGA